MYVPSLELGISHPLLSCQRVCPSLPNQRGWGALACRAGIFKQSMGARYRGGIGISYRPAPPGYIGWRINALKSIPGLHKRLKIRVGGGWGSPNSNDWRKSLGLCLLCGIGVRPWVRWVGSSSYSKKTTHSPFPSLHPLSHGGCTRRYIVTSVGAMGFVPSWNF